jgi:serralysin
MPLPTTTPSTILFDKALSLVRGQLALFAKSPTFLQKMQTAFGGSWSATTATTLVTDLANGKLPTIEVVADLGGAMGGYAAVSNTIYLSADFLKANQKNPQAIAKVLLEEIGHSIDARLNPADSAGDEGEIFSALVNNRPLSVKELAALKSQNDHKVVTLNGKSVAIEQASYGSINVDGLLTDWTVAERIDTAPNTGVIGYEVYGKYAANNYLFAIKSAVAIGAGSTIWIDADRNSATGYQIFGLTGGAEYNIQIGVDGVANLYSGAEGQTFVSALDYSLSADGKSLEVAVSEASLGTTVPTAISVMADVNNSVYLPGDYSTGKYTVTQTGAQTTYGNISLNGNLTDWSNVDRLDYVPTMAQAGYQVFGKSTAEGYVFAINSAVAIGADTTIWLDTDRNKTTGFQIFGTTPTSVGAEYNINIASDGNAYLYSGGAGQNLIAKVDAKRSADGKQWEVGVSKNLLATTGAGINLFADVNNTVFLPGDYSLSPLTVSNTPLPTRTSLSKKVGIVYSETSANKYFDKRSYNQLFTSAQNQAMQAGVPFDMLTEADLKDLSKVAQYDSLIFPYFNNVKAADVSAIENVLTQASQKYGVGMIAAGDFMSLDENGVALAGDPYQRLKNIFDVTRVASALPGANILKIKDAGGILSETYTAGEELMRYDNISLSAYGTVSKPGTVLAEQIVGGVSYNAIIATQNGGRNVHFADPTIFADSNLPWQGLEWSVYGDKTVKARVGLDMTRNTSMFISRDDVDLSRFLADAPGVETQVGNILAEWKAKYNFVGSHYINIGNDPVAGEGTDWAVMRPIYQKWLALGNEIATHSYSHPDFVSNLTPAQLEFEFNQSRLIIAQQLGISINGAATPGNPESLLVQQEMDKYFQYFSGVGTAYKNSFGFLTPTSQAVYFGPNLSFDFTLIDFKKLTTAQAEAVWTQEYNQLTQHGNNPFIEMPWHDYGVVGAAPGYTRAMFENFIARAYNNGTEFITLDDAQQRIRAFEKANLTVDQVGDVITAKVENATNIGKFALDIDAPGKVIKSVSNYYAYDNDSVFMVKTGGTFTINLGTAMDDVSHITSLAARSELISITGNGTNLSFNWTGEGKVTADMQAIASTQRYRVTGADLFKVTGDKVELTFNTYKNYTVGLTVVDDSAPIVSTPIAPIIDNVDVLATKSINLSSLFKDIDGDAIATSLVSNSNTTLLNTTLNGNLLTLNYAPYEFGTTTITVRGTAGGKSVDSSFNVTLNSITPIVNGTNNAETINGGAGNEIIKGLLGNDVLYGNGGNDVLIGGGGNDILYGGVGNDVLIGANPLTATPGMNSYDVLQGDGGNDRYILGDVNAVYYNDGISTNFGRSDYAAILGFATGDVIQLKGKAADYSVVNGIAGTQQGTMIQSTLFGQPELIGFVYGVTNMNLSSTAFAYV